MRTRILLSIVLLAFALVSTVSAFAPINFTSHSNGNLIFKYLGNGNAIYDDQFGIDQPLPRTIYGHTVGNNHAQLGDTYNVGKCYKNTKVEVVFFIKTPPIGGSHTYYSNAKGSDDKDHAQVIKQADGSFYVGFEDSTDFNFKDVQLNIACIPESIPTPEFPVVALPAALVVGLIGAILFIRSTKEN